MTTPPIEWLFTQYFDLADELYGQRDRTDLSEFDSQMIAEARQAADQLDLEWPPYLPVAEDYALDHPEIRNF